MFHAHLLLVLFDMRVKIAGEYNGRQQQERKMAMFTPRRQVGKPSCHGHDDTGCYLPVIEYRRAFEYETLEFTKRARKETRLHEYNIPSTNLPMSITIEVSRVKFIKPNQSIQIYHLLTKKPTYAKSSKT